MATWPRFRLKQLSVAVSQFWKRAEVINPRVSPLAFDARLCYLPELHIPKMAVQSLKNCLVSAAASPLLLPLGLLNPPPLCK